MLGRKIARVPRCPRAAEPDRLPGTVCSGTVGLMSHVRETLLFTLFQVQLRAA